MTESDKQKLIDLRAACDAALRGEPIQTFPEAHNSWEDCELWLLLRRQFRPKPKPRKVWISKEAVPSLQKPYDGDIEFVEVMK